MTDTATVAQPESTNENDAGAVEAAARRAAPLFYRDPEALTAMQHGGLSLVATPDFRFARNTNSVPIAGVEFAAASRFYPIVFAGDPAVPVAVLGLQDVNLFVADDGRWVEPDHYMPAYIRRYPFIFIEHAGGLTLGLDRACERIVEAGGGEPLFVDGKPSAFTRDALEFSAKFQSEHLSSRAFGAALAEQGLLSERAAQGALGDGRRFNVQGFRIVDVQKFADLPDAVVADWHRKGWLGLVHFHLASLDRFRDLTVRMSNGAQ